MEYLEIITIGLPFCAFKIVTGLFFNQNWLIALGLIDFLINALNLLALLLFKKRKLDPCFLSFVVRIFKKPDPSTQSKWQDLGNSLDVLLSFSLVAYVIGGGFIKAFPPLYLSAWNLSVILNVFGAGYGRITHSIQNLRST